MSSEEEIDPNQQIELQNAYPWIDNNLFEEMLRIDFPTENLIIRKYFLMSATGSGENYCSQMIRAKVNYVIDSENKQTNFIIKAEILTQGRKELFNREISAYNELLPKVNDLLNRIGDKSKVHGR